MHNFRLAARATAGRGIVFALLAIGGLAGVAAPASATATAASATAAPAGRTPARESLRLVLPLAVDLAGLQRFTEATTTPGSPQYAHYRSIAWLAAHFGAGRSATARVTRFLRGAGASGVRVDATGLFVDARMPAVSAERLFSTSLSQFHAARGRSAYTAPTSPVVIPRALQGLVTGVVGLNTRAVATVPALARATPSERNAFAGSSLAGIPAVSDAAAGTVQAQTTSGYEPVSGTPTGCPAALAVGGFSPNQYVNAYALGPLQTTGTLGQGERVALIEIDGFRQSDIAAFAQCFGLHLPKINGFGVGVSKPLPPGGEATLDLEVLDAAAPNLRAIDVYESNPQAPDVLQALTAPLQNAGYKPQVISASLGLCEQQTLEAVGRSGINAAEGALEEAADSGITTLAASGDDGSADCVSSSSSNALPEPELAVNYPASSPWVTSVGGTNVILNPQNEIESQTVWNDANVVAGAAGGGGLSAMFNRPSYQDVTVTGTHRAVPDVALLADVAPGYDVYCTAAPDCIYGSQTNPWQTVGGTSAATPLAAGGFALIDQLLRAHQLQGLGFANPVLYDIGRNPPQAAIVFGDVTIGSNDVGPFIQPDAAPLGCCTATPGYDEASGWGAINFQQLSAIAVQYEAPIVDVSLRLPRGQRPVFARHLLATVTCTGRCLLGAYAKITIRHGKSFTDYSNLYHLGAQGRKTVKINFTKAQLTRLENAILAERRITATIYGAIVDPAFNVERESMALRMKITR